MADKVVERESWGNKVQFLLSCIGYSVSLGTVWRFPYLCYKNGGATFVIPYLIMLVVVGLPMFFMELALGQFASEGSITVWKVSPAFHGIGFAMVITSFMVSIYFNVVIMYAVYYMFVSFVNLDYSIPWGSCGNSWNTNSCRTESYPALSSMTEDNKTMTLFRELYNQPCVDGLLSNISDVYNSTFNSTDDLNSTMIQDDITKSCLIKYTTASEEYWERYVLRLHESDGFEDLGGFSLKNTMCLFLTWLLIFVCLKKGIKSSGKVVYFTATFPYVIMLVLLIRGVTLPGHEKGISFYMTPQLPKLTEAKVWGDAATQIFYSLGPGFGGLLTMSSFNKFKNNCEYDAIIVSFVNFLGSLLAGFTIFSILGFMAHTTNQDVQNVVDQGPGLAFIAYPEAIARLPVSPLWALLFFFMLLTLGLDTQLVMMQTLLSGITDIFPRFLRAHKTAFTGTCCLIGFLLGLPQVTKGGIYMLTLMDWYCASYNLMLVALTEIICIMYVYGVKQFMEDIKMMLGHRPNPYWVVTWAFLTPLSLLFIVIMSATQYTPANYGDYRYPPWAEGIGWCMVVAPLAVILLVMVIHVYRLGPRKAFTPRSSWGPANQENRTGRYFINGKVHSNMGDGINTDNETGNTSVNVNGGFDNPGHYSDRL
ncbi:sodium- and chloride-dependent glycine transporter 2-like isoform X1 [Haliotis rufescens]|uniref:sodium- and chloride-dependent glycine transporter 2-like isoform X1 n=1 Tax=Haliotis rufescens TaxID=6454 RepID=UPI00201FA85B|nr:sodium- and chloride-dependent glycine transporter 2-like isoform X1 [Haliotis rufescens]